MTHAALKDRLALVRDALKPMPWAKGEAGNPSMADTVQEAIAAISAMEGEAAAYADPLAFENFRNYGHRGGEFAREWMWAKPQDGLVPIYTAPPPQQAGGDAEPPSNEVWPPAGAVWLAPVATDAPANPKLMQHAWGRSSLSSGQMAEAYQCIVSAAQDCGQVYRLPVATPPQPEAGGGVTEAIDERSAWHKRYIAQMIARGVPADFAVATCEAGYDDHQYDDSPEDAADNEISYMADDESGDAP